MRNPIVSLILLCNFIIFGCNKNPVTEPPHNNVCSASVNGTSIIPVKTEVLFGGSSIPGARQVNINVTENSGRILILVMLDYDGTIKTFTQNIGGIWPAGGSAFDISSSTNGEIILSSIDKVKFSNGEVVNGTFHFVTGPINGTYNVTNGSFSVFVKN